MVGALLALPAPPAAATCVLIPQLKGSQVNQGLPSYREAPPLSEHRLVAGKETLFKLLLAVPACAANNQGIKLAPGSQVVVDLLVGTQVVKTTTVTTPMSGGSLVRDALAPALESPGDPVYLVPGDALTLPSGGAFTARFSPIVKYDNGSGTIGTCSFASCWSGGPPTADFDIKQNPLKVLAVPMGDFSSSTVQFPAAAQTRVQAAFQSVVSRIFPTRAGIGSLAAPSGDPGLRYTINAGLLDLGPNGLQLMNLAANEKFCGTSTNFSVVENGLINMLATYNAANPTATAARVVGLIHDSISNGPPVCWQGAASPGGVAGWSRVFSSNPDFTGPVVALELGHTLGLSWPASGDASVCSNSLTGNSGFHSGHAAADTCSPGQAFNTTTGTRIASSAAFTHADFGNGTGWTSANVLMEPMDYKFGQCVLGGTSTACQGKRITRNFTPAADDRPRFRITGSITSSNPETSTVDIGDSYVTSESTRYDTEPVAVADARWVLTYLKADGSVIDQEGLFVTEGGNKSGHSGASHEDESSFASDRSFTSSRALPPETARVELWDTGDSGSGSYLLYGRTVDPNAPPTLSGSSQEPDTGGVEVLPPSRLTTTDGRAQQDGTPTPAVNESAPALWSDGALQALAWSEGSKLYMSRLTTDGLQDRVVVDGEALRAATNPSFSHDGKQIVYERDGSIVVKAVSISTDGIMVESGPGQVVYVASEAHEAAHHPSFAPDAARIAIEHGGNIFVIYPPGYPLAPPLCSLPGEVLEGCSQLTNYGSGETKAISPSWTRASTVGEAHDIAFTHGNTLRVVSADPKNLTSRNTQLALPDGHTPSSPSFGNGRIVYASGSDLFLAKIAMDLQGAPIVSSVQQLTHLTADSEPSLFGLQIAYQRAFPEHQTESSQTELMSVSLREKPPAGTNTYGLVASDDTTAPADLRAEFVRWCPSTGLADVLGAAVRPYDTDGTQAYFRISANPAAIPTLGCAGGVVRGRVSDGGAVSPYQDEGPFPDEPGIIDPGDPTPVVVVSAPTVGSRVAVDGSVVLLGTAYAADTTLIQDDSAYTWSVRNSSSGAETTYPPAARVETTLPVGSYTATLTVTHNGRSASAGSAFEVVDPAPIVRITSPGSGSEVRLGQALTVSGAATDNVGNAVGPGSFEWTLLPPDGALPMFRSGVDSFSFTPTVSGAWTLQLAATDATGRRGFAQHQFTVTAMTANVSFAPTTLHVPPPTSESQWVTLKVRITGQDLLAVDPSSVRVVRIGRYIEQIPALPGHNWSVSGTFPDQTATVHVDRKVLGEFLNSHSDTKNTYVRIELAGVAPTYSFSGHDPSSPHVKGQ